MSIKSLNLIVDVLYFQLESPAAEDVRGRPKTKSDVRFAHSSDFHLTTPNKCLSYEKHFA
jgi:hypothetical protein